MPRIALLLPLGLSAGLLVGLIAGIDDGDEAASHLGALRGGARPWVVEGERTDLELMGRNRLDRQSGGDGQNRENAGDQCGA